MEFEVRGRRVFAATGGAPFESGRATLVLVHGAGMDHTVWSMQARYFAHHGFSVLGLDLPGHGRSQGPAPDSVPGYADWLAAALDAAGARDVHLVGHSLGALIVLAYAARYPDAVSRLALLGALAHMPVHPDLLGAARDGRHEAYESIVGWGVGRRGQIGGHRAPGLWVTGASLRLLEAGASGALANDLAACNDWKDGLEAAAAVTCPALLLLGSDDRMTPARAAAPLAEALADSSTVLLERAGHMMMVEQPDETLDALAAFMSG